MTSQGLRATSEGIRAAKTALTDKTLSQHRLAIALGITRQPVSKFFAGEAVSRSCFVQICQYLGLSWQKVAGLTEDLTTEATIKLHGQGVYLNSLVSEIRQKRQEKIQDQCGTLQMLDIGRVIPLDDIYTTVCVLEKITSQQWLEIADLAKDCCFVSDFNQLGQDQLQRKLPGLEAALLYSKLMLLGKPGSGKTTFLKYLALECNKGEFQGKRIAIFISLKDFAEDVRGNREFSLLQYIIQEFLSCLIESEATVSILAEGKALILLDGLDEVPAEDAQQISREIRRFTQTYYKNRFIISCRIAGQAGKFPGFTEVEIADFDIQQVKIFAKNWFVAVAHNSREHGETTGNLFIHQLHLPENQQIRELTVTPILLHLICLLFQSKSELTYKPAKLFEQALNILLSRWDETRGIQRFTSGLNLNLSSKKKLLYQIAAITFEQGNYLFEQEKIQQLIAELLDKHHDIRLNHSLLSNKGKPTLVNRGVNALRCCLSSTQHFQDSKVVLKLLTVGHGLLVERSQGIYSFSHVAFQKYLTAKNIVENYSEQSINQLVQHTTEERWQNVFLFTASMLPSADQLLQLMKDKIDFLVASEQKIQDFLIWLQQKSNSVITKYKAGAIRAFYLVCVGRSLEVFLEGSDFPRRQLFSYQPSYGLERAIVGNLAFNRELAIDEFLTSTFACAGELDFACDYILNDAIVIDHAQALSIAFDNALNLIVESEFKQFMQILKAELPNSHSNYQEFRYWWKANGKYWSKNLRAILIKYRNICHDWQFNQQQIELLQQYYNANKFLIDCLNSSKNVTPAIQQKIEDTLLLAIAQIKN
jgi:predicted NACHT family NTPase